ncbi:MAG: acyltransferase domain-containing protein, partial [Cyanobacteria bacterium J06643_4]
MRSHFSHRLAITANSATDASRQLKAFVAGEPLGAIATGIAANRPPKIAFLFTGQGSQYEHMGQALYETEPVFRRTIDRCNQLISVPSAQTALFLLQYALTQLWQSWGIAPAAVLGHSIGEYAAACSAGIMDWEAALLLVERRSQLMTSLPAGGGMAAVMAAATQVVPYLQSGVTVAADNGPLNTVISGPQTALNAVLAKLDAQGIQTKKLKVNNGFHSSLMEPILDEFSLVAQEVTYRPSRLEFISTVTGNSLLTYPPDDWAVYWTRHIRKSVQFWQGIRTLAAQDIDIFVEIGPKPTLLTLGQVCLQDDDRKDSLKTSRASTKWLASLRPSRQGRPDDRQTMLSSLAQLHVRGAEIDWPYSPGRQVALPTYPFQRERHWIEVTKSRQSASKQSAALETVAGPVDNHPLLGSRLSLAKETSTYFQANVTLDQIAFLKDHRVFDREVLPAVGYLEIAIAAMLASNQDFTNRNAATISIRDVTFHQALIFESDQTTTVQTVLTPQENKYQFEIFGLTDSDEWQRHASGTLCRANTTVDATARLETVPEWDAFRQKALEVSPQVCYQQLEQRGIYYGEPFRAIRQVFVHGRQAFSHLRLPDSLLPTRKDFNFHPILLDACLQSLAAIFSSEALENDSISVESVVTYLPAAIESVQLHVDSLEQTEILSYVEITAHESLPNSGWLLANLELMSLSGERLVSIKGLRLQPATKARVLQAMPGRIAKPADLSDWLYTVQWQADKREYVSPAEAVEAAIAGAEAALSQTLQEQRMQRYLALLPQLEKLANDYIIQAFFELQQVTGEDSSLSEMLESQSLLPQWEIIPQHEALFSYLTQTVVWPGAPSDQTAQPSGEALSERYQQLLAEHPEAEAELTLIQRCGAQLANVLQGKIDPLTLLVPGGDVSDLFRLYHQSPGSQLMNQQVRQIILSLASCQHRPIRILEIGGGTGGTTASLLPALSQQALEQSNDPVDKFSYTFTDVSPLFVAQAKERFSDYSNLTYQPLDIERSPGEQGVELGAYDVVIAANVLHATADVEHVLEHVQSLLTPNGQLVLLEGTRPLLWLDLIFGMTAGWWKRDAHPLMSIQQWQRSLEGARFERPRSVVSAQGDALPQSVLVASAASSEPLKQSLVVSAPGMTCADLLSHHFSQQTIGTQLVQLEASDSQSDTIENSLSSVLELIQGLAKQDGELPQLLVLTQGATDGAALEQSPLWGLMRVVALEFPALNCCRLDLDPQAAAEEQMGHICQELKAVQANHQKQQLRETIRYRAGKRQV